MAGPVLNAGRTLLMGILNVTPDSFSDGGQFSNVTDAFEQARRMVEEGADILDIGGESTRPGAKPVTEGEELRRVMPLLERVCRELAVTISVDTSKAAVAEASLARGAKIINDVTGFRNPAMVEVAAAHRAACIVMHMRGTPETMQSLTEYDDVVAEVKEFLAARVVVLRAAGIEEIAIDPGLGFAKTAAHNFALLRRLPELVEIGAPVVVGPSRKRFLATLADMEPMENRRDGTVAAITAAVLGGARIIRAHDMAQARRAIAVAEAVLQS
ncbi:MAG TPA: dihydropteroate synthase [Bryobacteraceae bacterium]|nr:dihydropteroate synthase [Bryobacteraceae bacterium]